MPISKRPSVSTDSECASQAKLQGVRSGEAYIHVPTRRSARVAATANVGPGAGCHYWTSGIRSVEKPLSAIRRTWSRHAGRSVLSGATTPNRKLLAPPVASLSVIVAVLSIHFESIVRAAVPLLTAEQAPTHRPHARHDPQARPISAHTGVRIAVQTGHTGQLELVLSGSLLVMLSFTSPSGRTWDQNSGVSPRWSSAVSASAHSGSASRSWIIKVFT